MEIEIEDRGEPLFMISAVAKMVAVHPQTLRQYERMGLIGPHRAHGKKRLYSVRDVEHLRFIQGLTRDRGVNLAGVKVILDLREQMQQLQREMRETLEVLKKKFYENKDQSQHSAKHSRGKGVRIKIEHG